MNWTAPVHLIGHSYGGGVALRVAVERSNRIASLTLYEPTAFQGSPGAYLARSEINSLRVPASVQSVIAATGRPARQRQTVLSAIPNQPADGESPIEAWEPSRELCGKLGDDGVR